MRYIIKNKLPVGLLFAFASFFVGNIANAQTAPGGVSASLSIWLKADAGTSTTTSGSTLSTWTDQSTASHSINQYASQPPTYSTATAKLKNFNPTVVFNGASAMMRSSNIVQPPSGYSMFMAGNSSTRFMFYQPSVVGYAEASPELYYDISYNSYTAGGFYTHTNSSSLNGNKVYSSVYNSSTKSELKTNDGVGTTMSLPLTLSTAAAEFWLGVRPNLGYSTGDVSEVIAYTTPVSNSDRIKVESYLAIKYGVSMNNGTGMDYINSAGTTIWSSTTNTGYNNRVAGIGRDDTSILNQKQSQSSYSTGAQVTVSIGTVATTNQLNSGTIATDKQFWISGDDNGSITAATTISGLGTLNKRFTRVWKTQNTNSLNQQITIYFPVSNFTILGTTPYLLYATTAALLNTGATAIPSSGTVSINGISNYAFTIPGARLGNMSFFSFGGTNTPIPLSRTHILVNPSSINSSQQNGRLK